MSGHGKFGNVSPIQIDPAEGYVIFEELDGVVIQGARVLVPGPDETGYWNQPGDGPDQVWSPSERRLRIAVNKKTQRIRYEHEDEGYVEIIIEDREIKDAPSTGKLI